MMKLDREEGGLTCSTQSQPNKIATEKPVEFHHFPQLRQQLRICKQFVEGKT